MNRNKIQRHLVKANCPESLTRVELMQLVDIFLDIINDSRYNEIAISKQTLMSEFQLSDKNIS